MPARMHTWFSWCNDIAAMRRFYSQVVGLPETYHDEGPGWLTYQVGELQLVFMRAAQPLPVPDGWARQPGWTEGTEPRPSWVVAMAGSELDAAAERARQVGAEVFASEPRGDERSGRALFLRDPMGVTVELYAGP